MRAHAGLPTVLMVLLASVLPCRATPLAGQTSDGAEPGLAALLHAAEEGSPAVRAGHERTGAAQLRVDGAGALPDPMLTLGLMNLPFGSFLPAQEGMSMAVLEVGQRIPAPGVRSARTEVASLRVVELRHAAEETLLGVRLRIAESYLELLYLDEAANILARNRDLLEDLEILAVARLSEGEGSQVEVLRAQSEIVRLTGELSDLRARQVAAGSALNAELGRPSGAKIQVVPPAALPTLLDPNLSESAFSVGPEGAHPGLDLPSLLEVQDSAARWRPLLLAAAASRERSQALEELTYRERLPDLQVMVGYGYRDGMQDLWSASVSVGIPIFRERKQRLEVEAVGRDAVASLEDERALVESVRAEIAEAWAELARGRERFQLLDQLLLPQAEAAAESTIAAYRVGSSSFSVVLEAVVLLARAQLERARTVSELGRSAARLDRVAGTSLLLWPGR
jgi:outer membrane protein, heavy metal efflux system